MITLLHLLVAGAILTALCLAIETARVRITRARRIKRLRRYFREAYHGSKKPDYIAYVDRQNAEIFHAELDKLGV